MRKGICLIERLYVPYGQTVRFETLRVDKLIVDGNLIVEGKISAVICRGKGSVQVGDMEVDKLRLSSVTCEGSLKAREVISRRVYAESVHISKRIWCLNSVYTRSGQNSTPNSNATNLHSSQKRCCSFCISSSNASPTFQVQKSIFHQMTKPIQVTVILPLLLAISLSWNDDIHSSISGISNDLIGVIPTIGQ